MVLRVTVFVLVCLMTSCLRYSSMKMRQQDYRGNGFRIDGYYYNKSKAYREGRLTDNFVTTLVFYRNGFFSSAGFGTSDLREVEDKLMRQRGPITFLESSGYYQVSGDSISIEFWTNVSHFPVPTATVPARILNDTTLKSSILGHYDNDVWHFRPLSPKPDSTTIFDEQLEKGLPIKRGKKQKLLGII